MGPILSQDSKGSPTPDPMLPWRFYSPGEGWITDSTIKMVPEASPEVRAAAIRLAISTLVPIIAVLLLLVLVLALCCCCKRRRKRKELKEAAPAPHEGGGGPRSNPTLLSQGIDDPSSS